MLPALLVKERKNKKMADNGRTSYSIVEYFGENDGYRCGYCKSTSTNFSHGMWADSLTVQDYQYLMDRGWRRSGQYIYKPTMHLTCCPMYTIRCFALDFKLTKSQKKIIKRVNRFLATGERRSEKDDNTSQSSDMEIDDIAGIREEVCKNKPKADSASNRAIIDTSFLSSGSGHSGDSSSLTAKEVVTATSEALASGENISESTVSVEATTNLSSFSSECARSQSSIGSDNPSISNKSASKPGVGADASKPACKKAKLLRLERKKQKLLSKGLNKDEVASKLNEKTAPAEKTVEDFINEPLPTNPAHRLEIVLVACGALSTRLNLHASWALYVKYQTRIHKETLDECSYSTYLDFLVRTPLEAEAGGPPSGYGSFHQQYWLDNKLIAVGVIDILPNCISSVYFYYDPDYSDLSLGTYASLRETAFTRSLHYHDPVIKYYYMGFYIDSCQKMRYKGRLKPSYLLCPETYTWHPIEDALVKLKKSKYSRLNDDVNASDPEGCVNVNAVLVLYHNVCMDFRTYRSKKRRVDDDDDEKDLVKQYASLVGMKCAKRLLLVRS